jgi:heme a synthase
MNATTATPLTATTKQPGPALRRFAWCVLGWNVLVVLWGAVVRATGSGAGCGNHWPLCNGEVVPQSPAVATIIEFTHRMMTVGATVAVLGLLVWTFRGTAKRHLARAAALASTLLLFNEAFLGAMLVKLGYVVRSESPGRFVLLPIHLANTLLLLGALALTAHFLSRRVGMMRGSIELRSAGIAALGLLATILVGVSGSLAALGDTLFPATTLRGAMAQDFAANSLWILRWRWTHPAIGLVAGVFICWLVWAGWRNEITRSLSGAVAGLLALQYVLGVGDVLLLAPTWMQIVHLLGADLLWVALVVLTAMVVMVPIGCSGAHRTCAMR